MTEERDFYPWDDIHEGATIPTGKYHVRGVELKDGITSTGKRMFSAQIEVEEPADFAGMMLFENFVVGTDEAPNAIMKGAMGTRQMKAALKAAQVQSNSVQALCAGFAGSLFGITVTEYVEEKGDYAGTPRNRVSKWWKRGEDTPGIGAIGGGGAKGPAAAASAAAAATAAPPPPPPPAPPTGAPSMPPAAPAQAAPPVPPPAAPTAAPPAPPAPPPPAPPAPAPATAAADPAVVCPKCQVSLPRSEMQAHLMQCIMA